ncbi:hypothetical protein [Romboutsia sp.]|uniref:hypothetical protein n=1 Tax=Romboutsia sp. TaxID=1965302 RepID=UPI003F37F94B
MPILSTIAVVGWVLLGAVASTILITFWDDIRTWLNNVAANAVEQAFGYKARGLMQRAIAKIDVEMNSIKNKATIYTKSNPMDKYFVKTDIVARAPMSKVDPGIIEEIKKEGTLVQEYCYKG